VVFLIVQSVCLWFLGWDILTKLYPLLVHLPQICIFSLYYKRPWRISFVSLFSAFLCCQPPLWALHFYNTLFDNRVAESLVYGVAAFLTYYFLKKYAVKPFRQLIEISVKSCLIFGAIPFLYYLFDYGTTTYSDALYSGSKWAVHFVFTAASIFYFAFIAVYHYETKKQESLKYETDFARNIISSGRERYKKMKELLDEIRIMKHDYKFHLNTALEMLRQNKIDKSDEYLQGLQTQLSDDELSIFCNNMIINSLVADYWKRCKELDINIKIALDLPENFTVSDYEMCIVLGNLLENAVEACKELKENRIIELTTITKEKQSAILVRNTFNGKINKNNDYYISTKKDGGIGLKSVKAVVDRYGESFYTEYDNEWFSAYVLWKVNEENFL
jgi:hypothetical protein